MDEYGGFIIELERQIKYRQRKLLDTVEKNVTRYMRSACGRLTVLKRKLSVNGQRERVKHLVDLYISDVLNEVQKLQSKVEQFVLDIPDEVLEEIAQLNDAPIQPEPYFQNNVSNKPQQRRQRNPYRIGYEENEYEGRSSLLSALRQQGNQQSPESNKQFNQEEQSPYESQINVKQNDEEANMSNQQQQQQQQQQQHSEYSNPLSQLKQSQTYMSEPQFNYLNSIQFPKKQAQIRKLNYKVTSDLNKHSEPAHTYVDKYTNHMPRGDNQAIQEEGQINYDTSDDQMLFEDSEDEQQIKQLPDVPVINFRLPGGQSEDDMQRQALHFHSDTKNRSYAKLDEKLLIYTCEICGLKCSGKFFKLRQHLQEDHNIFDWFRCLECGSMHQNTSSLSEHIFMTHNVTYNGQHQKFQYRCKVTNKFYNPMESMKHIADTVEYHRQPPDGYNLIYQFT